MASHSANPTVVISSARSGSVDHGYMPVYPILDRRPTMFTAHRTYTFTRDGLDYTFVVTFSDPNDDTGETTKLRATIASDICRNNELSDTTMLQHLRAPDARICIMSAQLISPSAPSQLEKVLRRTKMTDIGFFMYHTATPCWLEYICIDRRVRGFGMGYPLFTMYETMLMLRFAKQCPRLYLAAVNTTVDRRTGNVVRNEPLFEFYALMDCHVVAPETIRPSTGVYVYQDSTGKTVSVPWPAGTDIMTKQLLPAVPLSATVLGNDVDVSWK